MAVGVSRAGKNEFAEALAGKPIIYATHAPLRRTPTEKVRALADGLVRRLESAPVLHGIYVPEVIDEYHGGRFTYKTMDPSEFATTVAPRLNKEMIVCRVVAQEKSPTTYLTWLRNTEARGIRNVVPVGGNTRHIVYPGPKVEVATHFAKEIMGPEGGVVGNISIPHRRGEANTMLWKTKMGADFFTTQMLYDSGSVVQLVAQYYRLCVEFDLKPATILLTFATVMDGTDLDFQEALGAEIPEKAKRYILESGDFSDIWGRSIAHHLRTYAEIISAVESRGTLINLGINVEQVTQRDLDSSTRLLRIFGEVKDLPSHELKERIQNIKI